MKHFITFMLCLFLFSCKETNKKEEKVPSPDTVKVSPTAHITTLQVNEFKSKIQSGDTNIVIIDVRSPEEYKEGHLLNSLNNDVDGKFDRFLKKMDLNKHYFLYCTSGVRSMQACVRMKELNFIHLYSLDGGIEAWQKAGLEVEI